MKKALLIFVVALAATASVSSAGKIPLEFSYIIYVEGKDAGRSTTKVTETDNTYIFESQTVVKTDNFSLDLGTKTEIDKLSFLPISFTYVGENRGNEIAGETKIVGKEAKSVNTADGQEYSSNKSSEQPILILEDFVMAHEVIIARAFWESGENPATFGMLLPSITAMTTVEIEKGSELAFESETKEAYCVKLIISMRNSSPFASFYDPERGIPVYLAFPGTATEVFLNEFFDGKPLSRYRAE
jgi:hypothetical protein